MKRLWPWMIKRTHTRYYRGDRKRHWPRCGMANPGLYYVRRTYIFTPWLGSKRVHARFHSWSTVKLSRYRSNPIVVDIGQNREPFVPAFRIIKFFVAILKPARVSAPLLLSLLLKSVVRLLFKIGEISKFLITSKIKEISYREIF